MHLQWLPFGSEQTSVRVPELIRKQHGIARRAALECTRMEMGIQWVLQLEEASVATSKQRGWQMFSGEGI